MTLVSSRVNLIHEVTIERNANAGTPDPWNAPGAPGWQTHLAGVPCRAWTDAGRQVVDATTTVVVEDIRLVTTLDIDVTAADRIVDITYRGATFIPGPIEIRAVLRHADHIELVLVQLS